LTTKLRSSGQRVSTLRATRVARNAIFPISLFLAGVGVLALAGCGANSSSAGGTNGVPGTGGTPAIVANLTLSPASAQSIDDGQTLNIAATLTNDSSGKGISWSTTGVGTLTNETTTGATYNAPATGAGSATITATVVADTTRTASLTIFVTAAPSITATSLPAGTEGAAYGQTVPASGGAGTLTFSLISGTLPAGLTLSGAGAITGRPSGPDGTENFTVKVTDSSAAGPQSSSQLLSITTNDPPPPTITTTNLPDGAVGLSYNQTLAGTCPSSATLGACTWAISSGSLPAGLNLDSSGAITGQPAGPASGIPLGFTVSYTDNAIPQQLATQSLAITISNDTCGAVTDAGNESLLNGSYVFLLKGFDDGTGSGELGQEPALIGGLLTFNGSDNSGLITAGTLDMNLNGTAGVQSNPITSGSYVMDASDGSNHRVCMTITTAAGTQHYRASLGNISGGVASTGHMIGFDVSGQFAAGTLRKQTATSLSDGSYAFGVSSAQNDAWCNAIGTCGGKFAAAGIFQLAGGVVGGGAFDNNSNGLLDDNSANAVWPTAAESINSGGTYTFTANGRGTLTFTPTASGTAVDAVLYAVSPTDALILGSDDQTLNNLFGGEMLQQSGGPFTNSALSGRSVVYFSSLNAGPPNTANVTIGTVTADGAGNFPAGTLWQNNSGTIGSQDLSGTIYSADPSGNGRVLPTGGASNPPAFWMVSANEAFLLGPSGGVESGMIEPQTSAAAPTATYAFGTINPEGSIIDDNSGVATFSGGNISGTSDDNAGGSMNANQTFGPVSVSVDASGLGSIGASGCTVGPTGPTGCQLIFYVISTNRAVLLNLLDGQGNAQNITALQLADQ
jgi:hypothetical protein